DVHVGVPSNAARLRTNRPPAAGVPLTSDISARRIRLHWGVGTAHPECWRTGLVPTLLDVVEWADGETAVACLDTAVQSGAIALRALHAAFAGASRSARLRVARVRPGSESGVESLVRQRLAALGVDVL